MNIATLFRASLALFLLLLFAACASFDRHWAAASCTKSGLSRWDGRWTSEMHHKFDGQPEGGRLRCVLAPEDRGRVRAYFHANWLCFSGDYDMTLEPAPAGAKSGWRRYLGTHDLPAMFGGKYEYDALVSDLHFTAHYRSHYDRGTFELDRVGLDAKNEHVGH